MAVTDEVFSVAGHAGWSGAYRVVMLGFPHYNGPVQFDHRAP